MELLSVIRRWHYRDHMSIREIERRTGLSRNTIRKYLRSDAVEVRFKVPERPSRLDPFADKLAEWLRVEAGKGRKARRTARRLHADLVVLGYDGSYARVAAFIRQWRAGREITQRTTGRGVFVPLAFEPGEAFQFDWSEDWAMIAGKRVKLQAAHTKLAHSRAFVIRAYLLQTHEMLFDALAEAFRVLGGVPRRGIFDNMRTAVDRIGTGKVRQVNARSAAMASHYLRELPSPKAGSGVCALNIGFHLDLRSPGNPLAEIDRFATRYHELLLPAGGDAVFTNTDRLDGEVGSADLLVIREKGAR